MKVICRFSVQRNTIADTVQDTATRFSSAIESILSKFGLETSVSTKVATNIDEDDESTWYSFVVEVAENNQGLVKVEVIE